MCVQYKNKPATALRDIVRKLKLHVSYLQSIKDNNRLKTKGKKLGQRS